MKKLFPILIFLLFTGCMSAQQVQPEKKIITPLEVITIAGDEITFQARNGQFLVAKNNPNARRIPFNLEIEEDRTYRVKFKYLDCDKCNKRHIEYLAYSIDPQQAQLDAAELLKF